MNTTLIASLAVVLYLASALAIAIRLFRPADQKRIPRSIGLALMFVGVNLHAWVLFQSLFTKAGLNLSFFSASSLIAWTILLVLLFSSLSKPMENLGIALLPLAALSLILQVHYHTLSLLPADSPLGLQIHVVISLLAYSLLAISSAQAVLLAIQDHHLRHRHPGGFIRALPPLQTMETLLFELIGLGFVLLTLSLLSGLLFLEDLFAQHLAHKTTLSIAAWLVFATLLWGRFRFGWRGQKALIWTLVGFVVLMLAYFGSKAVIELLLT
ncbi:MAG: cytochrome c biogenesis protein CcsA [gamma proteobacterium symbiont of Phacoides pectinatus]